MFKLAWRNTIRHPLRASLTVVGMAVAVLAFALLRTMVAAWYAGVEGASPTRLVTRNAISLIYPLPMAYLVKIQSVPGVEAVVYGNWFGGNYKDEKQFFPVFSVDPLRQYFEVYPEFLMPVDQKLAFFQDRRGAAAGRALASRYGWRLGDSIILKGNIYPGEWQFILRAIYTGAEATTDEGRFYFHWEYLNESLKKSADTRADQVSWFAIKVARPEDAPQVAAAVDAMFKNSLAETITELATRWKTSWSSSVSAAVAAISVRNAATAGCHHESPTRTKTAHPAASSAAAPSAAPMFCATPWRHACIGVGWASKPLRTCLGTRD